MSTITLNSGISFSAKEGFSILDSALLGDISLPYSCRTGRCSACKCKILNGSTRLLHSETGLTDDEKNEGWILSCVRSVESDVLLEIDDLCDVKLPIAKTLPCRIAEINTLAPDILLIKLRLPPAVDFEFIPGQYIDIIGPNGVRRSYSLANSSFEQKLLELHVRRVDEGVMSYYWFNKAKVNDLIRLNGPLGTFFLRDVAGINLIFLATGTGIAPIKSMFESLIHLPDEKQPGSITVLWGGRQYQDLYMDFSSIPLKHLYVPVLSRAESSWEGVRGHVQNALLALQPDLSNSVVYACGSNAMILDAKDFLKQAGLPANRFYFDAFVCSATN